MTERVLDVVGVYRLCRRCARWKATGSFWRRKSVCSYCYHTGIGDRTNGRKMRTIVLTEKGRQALREMSDE